MNNATVLSKDFTIIAGPCSAESPQQVMECAEKLSAMGVGILRAGVWKPRTRPGGFEGAGLQALDWLVMAREKTRMKLAVEVACTLHVEAALKAGIDMIWIGARTTASPFAVQEIAEALKGTDIPVLVKNPINPDINLWTGAIERLERAGICRISAIHRGFSDTREILLRYAPHWEIPIELRRRMPSLPVLCDPSHMAGQSRLVGALAQMALDMNADGLVIEVHPDPAHALSDSTQQLTPDEFKAMLSSLERRRDILETDISNLAPSRSELDKIDATLVELLDRRMQIARRIGEYKHMNNLAVLQSKRYQSVSDVVAKLAVEKGLDEKFVRAVFEIIHAESIRCQLDNNKKQS